MHRRQKWEKSREETGAKERDRQRIKKPQKKNTECKLEFQDRAVGSCVVLVDISVCLFFFSSEKDTQNNDNNSNSNTISVVAVNKNWLVVSWITCLIEFCVMQWGGYCLEPEQIYVLLQINKAVELRTGWSAGYNNHLAIQ